MYFFQSVEVGRIYIPSDTSHSCAPYRSGYLLLLHSARLPFVDLGSCLHGSEQLR